MLTWLGLLATIFIFVRIGFWKVMKWLFIFIIFGIIFIAGFTFLALLVTM